MKRKFKSTLAIVLSVAVMFTFIPMMGVTVSAATDEGVDVDAQLVKNAKAIYKISDKAVDKADQIASTLAYDQKYWDSSSAWRTAGSDAEHKAAKYIKKQWEKIGLEVKLDKVKLDKFQFNDASLTLTYKDGNKTKKFTVTDSQKDIKKNGGIISYASSGTVQRIKDEKLPKNFYNKLEIVDMGYGTVDNYDAYYEANPDVIDMSGKIVLVGTDQNYLTWITGPYAEAYTQGAEAVIAYPVDMSGDGKTCGACNKITNNVQDICCDNLGIPCTNVSEYTADMIKDIIKKDVKTSAKLKVDSEVKKGKGYTYNVVGYIRGTGNTGQRILYGGHYDKYFYGFEDNCTSIGTMTGIAKAMIDSNYKPVNDVVFIAHGAEEWGQLGTSNDWAMGSWHEISKVHGPGTKEDWTNGSTLAMFNIEMDGIYTGQEYNYMFASNENKTFSDSILNDKELLKGMTEKVKYVSAVHERAFISTDAICYQDFGIPCFMPWTSKTAEWSPYRYHTQYDNNIPYDGKEYEDMGKEGTYSKELLQQTIELGAVYGMKYDTTPAVVLDFASRCEQLEDATTGDEAYDAAIKDLRTANEKNLARGEKLNNAYKEAMKAGETKAAKRILKKCVTFNRNEMSAFEDVQDALIATDNILAEGVKHDIINTDVKYYSDIIKYLEDGNYENAYATAYGPNGYYDTYGMSYSKETLDLLYPVFVNDTDNWGKNVQMIGTLEKSWNAALDLANYFRGDLSIDPIAGYQDVLGKAKAQVQDYVDKEAKAIKAIAEEL